MVVATINNNAAVVPEEGDEKRVTCCWGIFRTNVEQGARIIACFGIGFNLLGALAFFLPATSGELHDPWMSLASLLYVFPCVCIIVALRRREARFFLPYLIFGVAEIVFYVLDMLLSVVYAFAPPDANVAQFRKEHAGEYHTLEAAEKGYRISQGAEAATLLACILLTCWFYAVVWAAYCEMRRRHPSQGRMRLSEISA